jgi:hypothetical protein
MNVVETIDGTRYTGTVLWQLDVRPVGRGRPSRETATVFREPTGVTPSRGGMTAEVTPSQALRCRDTAVGFRGLKPEVSQVSYPGGDFPEGFCVDARTLARNGCL